ncbi:hypothetical protein K8U54_03185 [Pseudomonas fulva]|uniref:hypothetical protein n=1 Tax=Pseudomonas fulva TaxID=47880 RepID=UPI00201E697F|nr:hypothetical protein [Pseudomonas fulva]UQY35513.1 hypothetical protein K8U54_03185 [Pseudomonas fulva]
MRSVIEKDVLEACFSGLYPDIFIAAHSSVIGVTPAIVEQYLNITDGVGGYKVWFDRVFSTGSNYCLVSPESLSGYKLNTNCVHSNYLGAAYHSSGAMIVSSLNQFQKLDPSSWGVDIVEANSYSVVPGESPGGAKIAEIISLKTGGKLKPVVISKYFKRENRIFIFDKTINAAGADFIIELTKYCDKKCKIVVMSNFLNNVRRGLLDQQELQAFLNKNKVNGTVECLQASDETIKNYHDRFVFLGNRFQMVFSSGLDCFGRGGVWTNSDGDVTVHCVYASDVVSDFRSSTNKIFRLKSKGY